MAVLTLVTYHTSKFLKEQKDRDNAVISIALSSFQLYRKEKKRKKKKRSHLKKKLKKCTLKAHSLIIGQKIRMVTFMKGQLA